MVKLGTGGHRTDEQPSRSRFVDDAAIQISDNTIIFVSSTLSLRLLLFLTRESDKTIEKASSL
jgi:hypothetical protein